MLFAELRGQPLALRSLAATRSGDHQQPHCASQADTGTLSRERPGLSHRYGQCHLAVHVPWYQGSPRILSGSASISACARRPTGIVFLVRCARWPLAARRLHSRSVRPRRNHGARPCRALPAWIYQTEVPAGLPASITGRRLDLRAHEPTAESTAGDGVAAAVTGICNRCIRHAARYRQGSAARRGQERWRG